MTDFYQDPPNKPGVQPLKPEDVGEAKTKHFPDAVIEAFNELIAEQYVNGTAKVKQKDVTARMVAKGIDKDEIAFNGYLNVEEMYRSQGWKVKYDKPTYYAGESYDAYFEFTRK